MINKNYINIISNLYSKGLFHLLGANSLILIFGFTSQLFVAWILSPVDIGTIKLLQTYGNIFVTIGGFGYNISVLKLCSENRPDSEKKYLYKRGLIYSIWGALISYFFIIILTFSNVLSKDPTLNNYMLVLGIGVIPQVTSSVYFSYLQALRKMTDFSKIQTYTKLVSILMLICLTYFFMLKGYIVALIIGYLLTNILLSRKIKFINKNVGIDEVPNSFKTHNQYSFISLFANFLNVMILSVDILIINYLVKDKLEIGYYSFGLTFLSLLMIYNNTIWQLISPYFSNISNDIDVWKKNVQKYNRLMMLSSIAIFLISICVVPVFLNYAFNGKYKESSIYFVILSVSWLFRSFITVKAAALFGLGKIKINMLVGLISLPMYTLFVIIGTVYFGLIGTSVGVASSSIIVFFTNHTLYTKTIKKIIV